MSNYLEPEQDGADSEFVRDLHALQNLAYLDGVRHVLVVMEASLEEKRLQYESKTSTYTDKMALSIQIDLLRKMVVWAREEVGEL